jgi:tetratricopeptide (TPR) repeat protein
LNRQLGRLDLAAAEFEKEIETAPGNTWAYKDLAEIWLDQGDVQGAIALLQNGVARNPEAPELLSAELTCKFPTRFALSPSSHKQLP